MGKWKDWVERASRKIRMTTKTIFVIFSPRCRQTPRLDSPQRAESLRFFECDYDFRWQRMKQPQMTIFKLIRVEREKKEDDSNGREKKQLLKNS